ncbi:hypothetical protein [uncultured Sulfitobacter sp.]|uniref:hypothetical protein n=1 Tax=uncultured Sulfitobacter sp. TaxID=191468 RepID=UPI002606F578|nr:hypothetical protein [uncultured Sulfitobacter sp.]
MSITQDQLFGSYEEVRLNLEASSYTQTAQITSTNSNFYEAAIRPSYRNPHITFSPIKRKSDPIRIRLQKLASGLAIK